MMRSNVCSKEGKREYRRFAIQVAFADFRQAAVILLDAIRGFAQNAVEFSHPFTEKASFCKIGA